MHLAEWKAEKRKKYLYLRDTLSKDERRKKSKQICHTLCMLEEYRQAVNVFCYVSFRSEVETIALIDKILLEQKHLYVPRVFGREMRFFEITFPRGLDIRNVWGFWSRFYGGNCGSIAFGRESNDFARSSV